MHEPVVHKEYQASLRQEIRSLRLSFTIFLLFFFLFAGYSIASLYILSKDLHLLQEQIAAQSQLYTNTFGSMPMTTKINESQSKINPLYLFEVTGQITVQILQSVLRCTQWVLESLWNSNK